MKKPKKECFIQSAGVMRCCIASVGGNLVGEKAITDWEPFDDPPVGMTDSCKYCGREFTLVDSHHRFIWIPTEWVENTPLRHLEGLD